jgi:hypothetical protein
MTNGTLPGEAGLLSATPPVIDIDQRRFGTHHALAAEMP